MSLETPENFNIRDLTLDVRLVAIVDGVQSDFTGKKIFSIEFFRKNIGFGITDIDIEVNTSLQPLITITFKDLYGNTVFGKTKSTNPDLSETDNNDVDFSVLFNWPPPKFLFTFKGFLGKSATWMLNMKKTSVSYDSSDGSYNIKCEFVPNQWGFLSDLPFLYLLAVKSLKQKSGLPAEELAKVQTIFDLIKIGKQVEVKTKEATKEFDTLLKQMTLLKSQRIYDAVSISKVVNYNEAITGQVGNQAISPFKPIVIAKPVGVGNEAIDSPEKIKALANNSDNITRINAFLLLSSYIGDLRPLPGLTFSTLATDTMADAVPNFEQEKATRIRVISDNVTNIENAIKKKTYDSSKQQLEKITIGQVFQQLAEDSGYIMGRILEVGFQGYDKNQSSRDALKGRLIGKGFPLFLTDDDKREEKPATANYLGNDIGVDAYEMAFVGDFIDAISEGIATELLSDQQATEKIGDDLIKKRINNIEALRPNPYKSFYNNIAENIMVRGAVVSFLTRSFDPNYPGDYDTTLGIDRATNAEDILALVDAEMENITDEILGGLTDDDAKSLKKFCIFWDNLLTEDCQSLREADSTGKLIEGDRLGFSYLSVPGDNLPNALLDYEVVVEKPAQWNGAIQSTSPLIYVPATGLETNTLRKVMNSVFKGKPAGGSSVDATNSNFIDLDRLQSVKLINNGIAYFKPRSAVRGSFLGKSKYTFFMISGPDANRTQQVMSAASDGDIKNEGEKQRDSSEPLGFLNIQNPLDKDGNLIEAVSEMNDNRIQQHLLLDYSRLITPSEQFFRNSKTLDDTESYFFVEHMLGPVDTVQATEIPAKNITLSIAYNPDTLSSLIFGPFVLNDSDSLVHRGWIKRMCVKLKEKLEGIEQKRNQIISDVLGKSAEQNDALYKQMHVLYQQWEVLIIKDSNSAAGQNTNGDNSNAIANEMGDRYNNHVNFNMAQSVADEASDNTFLYSYPLNAEGNTNNIDVKNSIINIDSLYKPNANTTVLNIIQQICTKNNFIFIPMPGEPGVFSTSDIFSTHPVDTPKVKNFFYVQFVPTPESRATLRNDDNSPLASSENFRLNLPPGTLEIKFGSPENKIVKNITVDTQESKPTAESIVNLQRLVDNENQNKTVTTDCSMLPVMEGRSYKASIEMLGNAQVFPMQFFLLDAIPLFNGLYQIMKVKHAIKPNDMTTTAEGIRMRMDFQSGKRGGIPPVTLETLANIPVTLVSIASDALTEDDFKRVVQDAGVDSAINTTTGAADAPPSSTVSTSGVILLPNIKGVGNSARLTYSTNPNSVPIEDTNSEYTKDVIVRNLNEFITDVLEPFAAHLKQNYPDLYKNWYITSAQRSYVPNGGSSISQHQKGQAFDSQIIGGASTTDTMKSNFRLLNAILEWHRLNPNIKYDQILWETRAPSASWIHWSYNRRSGGGGRVNLKRFVNDTTYTPAKINGNGRLAAVTEQEVVLKIA